LKIVMGAKAPGFPTATGAAGLEPARLYFDDRFLRRPRSRHAGETAVWNAYVKHDLLGSNPTYVNGGSFEMATRSPSGALDFVSGTLAYHGGTIPTLDGGAHLHKSAIPRERQVAECRNKHDLGRLRPFRRHG
jgi:hypothetical protein